MKTTIFEMFCWKRGADPDDTFLWSPALMLPLWNLMVIESLSTHAALEMLRDKRDENPRKKHGNIPL